MNNNFSENLKRIRKEYNLSQEQLAESLNVSRQAISKWESSQAYPEMDKIIALCDKFSLNIDDLLHKDIKEVKKEEEAKNNLNKYIEDFLKYITNTINLFSNMSFKSKIKCLSEQLIIALVLLIAFSLIYMISSSILYNIFRGILPIKIFSVLSSIIEGIFILFAIITSVMIITHIFKTRYLDYYEKLVKNKEFNLEEKNNNNQNDIEENNKILFKRNENKIIIRDPKHSEYKFINGLFKCIIGVIKFFALWLLLFLCFTLIGILTCFVLSFLIIKTGLFFIGIIGLTLSLGIINIIFILIILNFIFNRKNDKKKTIWTFIISLIIFGVSCGLTFIGTLNFNYDEDNSKYLKSEIIELPMNDNYIITDNVDFVEEERDNIKIEAELNKNFTLISEVSHHDYNYKNIFVYAYASNPPKLLRDYLKTINDKNIYALDNSIYNIRIYASKENINKIKENNNSYSLKNEYYDNLIKDYERTIREYEEQLETLDNE